MILDKFNYYFSPEQYKNKTDAILNTAKFRVMIRNGDINLCQTGLLALRNLITKGHILAFGLPQERNLLALDIDNNGEQIIPYEELLAFLKSIKCEPAMIFETLNSSESHPRYRFIFALKNNISTHEEYKLLIKALGGIVELEYPGCVDTKCLTATSVFYSGKELKYYNKSARILSSSLDLDYLFKVFRYCKTGLLDGLVKLDLPRFVNEVLYNAGYLSSKQYEYRIGNNDDKQLLLDSKNSLYRIISTNRKIKNKSYLFVEGENDDPPISILESINKPLYLKKNRITEDLENQLKLTPCNLLFSLPLNIFVKDIFKERDEYGDLLIGIFSFEKISGVYRYFRYTSGSHGKKTFVDSYDIYNIFKKLTNLSTINEIKEFIYTACNLTLKKKREASKVIAGIKNLKTENFFKKHYLKKVYARDNGLIHKILDSILGVICEQNEKLNYVVPNKTKYIVNLELVAAIMKKRWNIELKRTNYYAKIKMLHAFGLLDIVDLNLTYSKYRQNGKSYPLIVTIPDYNKKVLEDANQKAKAMLEKGIDRTNIDLYINPYLLATDNRYIMLNDFLKNTIKEQGYCLMDQCVELMESITATKSKVNARDYFKRYRPFLLEANNLVCQPVKANQIKNWDLRAKHPHTKILTNTTRIFLPKSA